MEMIRNFAGRFTNDVERAHFAGKLEKLKTLENVAKSVIDRAKVLGYLLVPEGAKPLPLGSRPPTNKDKRNNWNFFEVVTPFASVSGKELVNLDPEDLNLSLAIVSDRVSVLTEDKATEILRKEVKVDAGTACALIVPETALQSAWNDVFKPRQTQGAALVHK